MAKLDSQKRIKEFAFPLREKIEDEVMNRKSINLKMFQSFLNQLLLSSLFSCKRFNLMNLKKNQTYTVIKSSLQSISLNATSNI